MPASQQSEMFVGFGYTRPRSLLAPLRKKADDLIVAARASLEALDSDCHDTMGFDFGMLTLTELWRADDFARDMRLEMQDAILGREGYDTWPREDRERIIKHFLAVARAFKALAQAVRELREQEHAEVAALISK